MSCDSDLLPNEEAQTVYTALRACAMDYLAGQHSDYPVHDYLDQKSPFGLATDLVTKLNEMGYHIVKSTAR
jgi:hypothetical protein